MFNCRIKFMLKRIFVISILSVLVWIISAGSLFAADKNEISFIKNLNKTYSNINDQLESIVKLQKKQRTAKKKMRQIEYFKYQNMEDEVKFEEKKKKKERDLVKRLNKLNGNKPGNEQLVSSQLNKNSFDLNSLFFGPLFGNNSLF